MELNSDIISTIINTNPGDYGIYRLRDGRLEGIYA